MWPMHRTISVRAELNLCDHCQLWPDPPSFFLHSIALRYALAWEKRSPIDPAAGIVDRTILNNRSPALKVQKFTA